jgi:hypothetical protein
MRKYKVTSGDKGEEMKTTTLHYNEVFPNSYFWMVWKEKRVRFVKNEDGTATSVDDKGKRGYLRVSLTNPQTFVSAEGKWL